MQLFKHTKPEFVSATNRYGEMHARLHERRQAAKSMRVRMRSAKFMSKKILIPIIVIPIIVAGIGAYFVFIKPSPRVQETPAITVADEIINFHKLASGKDFGDILKLFNPAIDEQNRRLYVVGSKTTYVGVVDIDKDELIDSFDIGVLGGYLMFNEKKLYSFVLEEHKCYLIDTIQKKASEVNLSVCENLVPKGNPPKKWGNYSFLSTGYRGFTDGTSGFPVDWAQDLNGAYGRIEISDSSGKKVGEIVYGPDALYSAIDSKTGKLYTTNTGDGSISIFDLNKLNSTNYCEKNSCLIKEIDIGNSADQLIVDSSGNMYVRNRLGGSVIYKYNPTTKSFITINNEKTTSKEAAIWNGNWQGLALGMWPSDMKLSKDEKRLYVLSHYGALIDIIDTTTNKVVSKIKFDTALKPRTDSLSEMALDKSRDRLYAAWAELGLIGVADGKNSKVLGTIDLTKYGFDKSKAANRGIGIVKIAVDDNSGKLYVYYEGKLLSFNGDTLQKENEVSTTVKCDGEKMLVVNPDKKELYLGSAIFNLDTLKESGSFSRGQRVESFNNEANAVYLKEDLKTNSKTSLKIYEFINGFQTKEWTVDNLGDIVNTFFDFKNNIFYVVDFLSGSVIAQDLTKGSAPSNSGNPLPSGGQNQGRCGDGICDSFEKANPNLCPKDCTKPNQQGLSFKNPVMYQKITDGYNGRSPKDVANLLVGLKADFVFLAFTKWEPIPLFQYSELKSAISGIKAKMPNVLIVGGTPPQFLPKGEIDPVTGLPIPEEKLKAMALTPQSIGISGFEKVIDSDKTLFQPPGGYFPDLGNPEFHKLIVDWNKKQIDAGVDLLEFDLTLVPINLAVKMNLITENDIAYKKYVEAWHDVVNQIRIYAAVKGKTIYIGSNGGSVPYTDFTTISLPVCSREEFLTMKYLTDTYLEDMKKDSKRIVGKEVPIIGFIDVPGCLYAFGTELNATEQKQVLKSISEKLKKHGIIFVYPIHGGPSDERYDAIESGTYGEIKKLMLEQ
jgi:DNA-binding beta-propeller fold protein YncE